MNGTAKPYRFLAFEISLFSAKVRPALRYKKLWYDEERADLGEIQQRTGLGFIPIVITPEGETWQDSTHIYDQLEATHPSPPLFPQSGLQRLVAHLIELYHDEFSLIPAMHYRWGSPQGAASARSRFIAMIGNEEIGNIAADRMAEARLALGATDQSATAIEAHTQSLLQSLSKHFEQQPYLLGERMSFADCALMGTFYGHFFNDLVPRQLLLETARPVVGWIERCNYPGADKQGEWLAADTIAPSLVEILQVMGNDSAPMIQSMVRAIEDWADATPEGLEKPPRAVGAASATLQGQEITRFALPYTLFMVERAQNAFATLSAPQRERAEELLQKTGWHELVTTPLRHHIIRNGFELSVD